MSTTIQSNAFTVDVEEYFHASALAEKVSRDQWDDLPGSVEANTHKILDLLDESGQLGTFFVLGWICERYPQLIRDIHSRGHEVASHGHSHALVYNQSEAVFRQETLHSKRLLEDTIGAGILGYRAASFSFRHDTPWAYGILQEAGFAYDSSVFPISHDRYGDSSAPRFPYYPARERYPELIEFPLSTWKVLGARVPVSGGGYFRLLPPSFINTGLRSINQGENKPFIFYIHPWELDTGQPRFEVSRISKFRHYTNLGKTEARLKSLLSKFRFSTCIETLETLGFDPQKSGCAAAGELAVG